MTEGFVYLLTSINSPRIKIGGTENPAPTRVRGGLAHADGWEPA
ncbi:MAG: hypothetical protein NW223_24010 [Hyphomicrobiaceae bacterium]|nr:hypothetical protein [Hyphomicrobiaceae bacterium]